MRIPLGKNFSEKESWRIATAVMLAFSAGVFLIQRFILLFLDPIFEVCIFHIPALAAALVYMRKGKPVTKRE